MLNSTTTTYAYDTTDQLTGDGATTVTYDGTGNRNNGSYTTTTGNKMTSDGTWNYTYDDEGNQTRKTKISDSSYWTYAYDNENHLTEAAQYNSGDVLQKKVAFKYDVFGNRDQKYFDSNGDGTWDTTQRYAYDGWNPAKGTPLGTENFDIWADLDGSSSLTTRYLRADLVDQLMARIDSGTAYWELGDRLGSIGHVIDNNGTVKDAITYDGWGNATHSNSAFAGRYLYTGREWDTETNLQYNRARYYDPGTARWISQDPLGFDAGDSNLYRYVSNSPTNATDPSGQIPPLIVAAALAGWWLFGPGAGTVQAPTRPDDIILNPPRPLGEDIVAGLPGAAVMAGAMFLADWVAVRLAAGLFDEIGQEMPEVGPAGGPAGGGGAGGGGAAGGGGGLAGGGNGGILDNLGEWGNATWPGADDETFWDFDPTGPAPSWWNP